MRRFYVPGIGFAAVTIALAGSACAHRTEDTKMRPEDSVAYCVRMSQSMFNGGRVTDALRVLDECVQREPDNAALHHFRAQLAFRAGRLEEAEAGFLRAIAIDPYFADARNFLGAVYQELGRPDDAEREYRAALADPAYPTPEKVYLNLGQLYSDQGRDREAIESVRRAVELNPRYYQGHFVLAGLLERGDLLVEAAREYEVAEPGYRQNVEFYYRLGLAYFRLGQHDRARNSLSRALVVGPGSESASRADELLRMID